jgi:hypothetical protein
MAYVNYSGQANMAHQFANQIPIQVHDHMDRTNVPPYTQSNSSRSNADIQGFLSDKNR